jgi:hypothetical protein
MVRSKFFVYQRTGFAMFGSQVSAIIGRQFLFDDIRLEGNPQVVRLPGKIG